MNILIINGVNLSQLGTREVDIYGHTRFEDYFSTLQSMFPDVALTYFQSDKVEEIVKAIANAQGFDGIVLNPGAYTHTSIVLADAIKSVRTKVVEVHISNIFGREQFRKQSFIAPACFGSISGFGLKSYELAIRAILH